MHSPDDDLDNYAREVALLPGTLRRLPLQSIKIVTKPGVETIREMKDQANWSVICLQLVALVLIASIVEYLFYLLRFRYLSVVESFWSFQTQPGAGLGVLELLIFTLVGIVVLHWIARLFRGQGTFLTMLYTNLLFQVPLLLLTIVIWNIALAGETWPTITSGIGFAIQLYIAVLQVFTLRTVHGLSQDRALTSVLLLIVLFLPLLIFFGVCIL